MPFSVADTQSYRDRRLCNEVYHRSTIGPAFYAAGCLLLVGLGGYGWPSAGLHVGALIAFVLMLWLRRRQRVPEGDGQAALLARWQRHRWALIHMGCLLWSLVLARTGSLEGSSSTVMLVGLLCTVAYGTAVSEALGLCRVRRCSRSRCCCCPPPAGC